MTEARLVELRELLESRRSELTQEMRLRFREIVSSRTLAESNRSTDPMDQAVDSSSENIEIAVTNIKNDTLRKLNAALVLLAEGKYGLCSECGREIAENRLRALPFAVRCKDCEEVRERSLADSLRRNKKQPVFFDQ